MLIDLEAFFKYEANDQDTNQVLIFLKRESQRYNDLLANVSGWLLKIKQACQGEFMYDVDTIRNKIMCNEVPIEWNFY